MGTVYQPLVFEVDNPVVFPVVTAQARYIDGANAPVQGFAFRSGATECRYIRPSLDDYTSGSLSLVIEWYSLIGAVTGNVTWVADMMAITPGDAVSIEAKDFAATQQTTTAAATTAKGLQTTTVTIANIDSLVAGDYVLIRVRRLNIDTMPGDAVLVRSELIYTGSGGGGGGGGDVVGPATATDNAVARFDTTTGKLIQNSVVIISDTGDITGVTTINGGAPGNVSSTRTLTAGTGLTGGGDLSANRTFTADFGSIAGKVTEGNDARLSNARTPTAHAASHQDGGTDEIVVTGLSGQLADAQPLAVRKAGTLVGTRPAINIIDGTNITTTVADDAGNNRVNVTITASGSGGTLAGDVTGAIGTNTVEKIRNTNVVATAPTSDQGLIYNSTNTRWEPTTFDGDLSPVTGSPGFLRVAAIRGRNVSGTAPTTNQVYRWDGFGNWAPGNAVDGPASAVTGDIATYNGTTGKLIADSGILATAVVINTRTITAGTGLTGGGDLSANRTFAPDFGTGAGKVTQGNDSRLSDARTPTAHAASHQDGGTDEIVVTGLSGLLGDAQKVIVSKAGTTIGTRPQVNLIEGSNVTLTVADDAGNNRVNVTVASSAGGGGGTFSGPVSSTDGDVVVFNGTTGQLGRDDGLLAANIVQGPASVTTGRVASFNGTTGKLIQQGTQLAADLVSGPSSSTTGNLPSFNGTTGKIVQDSGVLATSVVVGPATSTTTAIVKYNGTTGKLVQDSGVTIDASNNVAGMGTLNTRTIANWVDGPASAVTGNVVSFNGTTGKLVQDSGVLASTVVVGPAFVTDSRVAAFDGTTGKLVKQGTQLVTNLVSNTGTSTNANIVTFNGTTGKLISDGGLGVGDLISGLAHSSVSGNLPKWSAIALDLTDSGIAAANVVQGPASVTTGRVASYNGTTGKLIADGGILVADVVTGPASSTTGNLPSFNGTTGKLIQDSGVLATSVVVGPASAVSGNITSYSGTTGKLVADSGVAAASVVVGPASAVSGNIATYNGTTGKLVQDSGVLATTITTHAARHNPAGADAMFTGTWVAGDVPQWSGSAWVQKQFSILNCSTARTVATTSPSDVTDLTVTLTRAGTFYFDFTLSKTHTAAVAIGITVNYTGTTTRVEMIQQVSTSATASSFVSVTTVNTVTAGNTVTAASPLRVSGVIVVSTAGGTFSVRCQTASGTLTIAAGSGGFVREA